MGNVLQIDRKNYLSITEAAAYLGVSRPTIYARMQDGELAFNQISVRTVRIPIEAIRTLQAETKPKNPSVKITKKDLPHYITRDEVIKKYKIEKSKFYQSVKKHSIPCYRYGTLALYPKDQIHELFFRETYPDVKEWYTSEELAAREGITRKHICATAHKLGIAVRRAGTVCFIDKQGWDQRKLAPSVIEANYITADQAKERYHIGGKHFYDEINANNVEKVKKGNFVYFPIKELDRLFKDKSPKIPDDIRRHYIRSCDALKVYHVGQKRFSAETLAANIEKVRTEGNYVWYRKDQLDKLFKTII